ncbi:hypothetical protein C0993_007388 [Termitomyces sp. T159_Od127]|nr:hypothetical protein C0993_007388 [Termitomyces sp. T159_Od127]
MVSPPRQVIVDDSDPKIHYSGAGWFVARGSQDDVGNFGPTYNKTSHGTTGNDSLSFSLDGSSLTVWGTMSLNFVDDGTSLDPKWECFVDGISIGATPNAQFRENNLPLCEQGTMTEGLHVITINITTVGSTFWFDYYTFIPSPSSEDSSATLLVQNTDSAILYDDSWRALGDTANMTTRIGSVMNFDFVGLLAVSSVINPSVTLTYRAGAGITWVGFIPTELPHNESIGSYSIDNGPSTKFELTGLPSTAKSTVYNQVFFITPDLPIKHHTISVTYEGSNVPSTPLTLDYLLIADAPLSVTTKTTPSRSTVSTTGTTVIISPISTVPSTTPHPSTPIGPIAGGVAGGLITITILLFAFWWWRRPRALHMKSNLVPYTSTPSMQRLQAETLTSSDQFAGGAQPSLDLHSRGDLYYATNSALSESDSNNRSFNINQSISHIHNYTTGTDTSDIRGHIAGTINEIRVGGKTRRVEPVINPVIHQDSGIRDIRLDPSQDLNIIVEDVPPMYTTN